MVLRSQPFHSECPFSAVVSLISNSARDNATLAQHLQRYEGKVASSNKSKQYYCISTVVAASKHRRVKLEIASLNFCQ